MDRMGNKIAEFYSMAEASRQTVLQPSHIRGCCTGDRKSTGGFTWRFKDLLTPKFTDHA